MTTDLLLTAVIVFFLAALSVALMLGAGMVLWAVFWDLGDFWGHLRRKWAEAMRYLRGLVL